MIKRSQQGGYSIIEVLITIVVIAFGFLSLLSLELRTLDMLNTNNQRMLAFNITSGMGERMRANVNNRASYGAKNTSTFAKNCTVPTACNLMENDIWAFKQALANEPQLPGSVGLITLSPGFATISITWAQRDGTNTTYSMDAPL